MALVYETGYDFVSKLGDREVKFKAWTAKNEREYLQLLETAANEETKGITDEDLFNILILPNIEDKEIILSSAEQKKLIIDIRLESINENVEDEAHECVSCKTKTDIKSPIKEFMKFNKANFEVIESGNLKFTFGPLKDNKSKENLKLEDGIVKYIFEDFMAHLHAIEINGVEETEFNRRELKKFIDKIPSKIFDEVFEKYQKQSDSVDLNYEFICPKCDTKEIIDYSFIPNFLWA